jgi:AcrR family transcriptional regulator
MFGGWRVASGEPERPGRTYQSARRTRAAADTRAAILDAALRLFCERGYGKVTVQDIAREASTAVPTVYASTGGKVAILGTLIEEAMGDPIAAETLSAVDECADASEAIRVLVHGVRVDNERYHHIIQVMKDAATLDDTAAGVLARSDEMYRQYLEQAVDHVRKAGTLRPGLTPERAADIAWYYLGHQSWSLLAVSRQWPWDDAEQWVAEQLTAALLSPQ